MKHRHKSTDGLPDPASGEHPSVVEPAGVADLTPALRRFKRRLANFGLGETPDPLFDPLSTRASGEHRS